MKLKLINEEQKRQIEIHKWLQSERVGHDLKEEACKDWVDHYAAAFREWLKNVPDRCIECGCCSLCKEKSAECPDPFNQERLRKLGLIH